MIGKLKKEKVESETEPDEDEDCCDEGGDHDRLCSLADQLEESGDKENAEFLRSIAEDRSMADPEKGKGSEKEGLSDKQMRLLQEKLRQKVSK